MLGIPFHQLEVLELFFTHKTHEALYFSFVFFFFFNNFYSDVCEYFCLHLALVGTILALGLLQTVTPGRASQ